MEFLVERYLADVDSDTVLASIARLQSLPAGSAVRYLWSAVVPGEQSCFCVFEAPSEQAVREVNERIGFPYARILPAIAPATQLRSLRASSVRDRTSSFR